MIVRSDDAADAGEADEAAGIVEIGSVRSLVAPEHSDLIRWDLGPDGFTDALGWSRGLFAARGNLSSPSVLFAPAAERGVMPGFWPGLALAGATYRFGPRSVPCPF